MNPDIKEKWIATLKKGDKVVDCFGKVVTISEIECVIYAFKSIFLWELLPNWIQNKIWGRRIPLFTYLADMDFIDEEGIYHSVYNCCSPIEIEK